MEWQPQWPSHKASMTLSHNAHKACYESIQDYCEHRGLDDGDWVSAEEKERAIAADDFWELQWYPDTPVGFVVKCAHDLNVLLNAVKPTNSPALAAIPSLSFEELKAKIGENLPSLGFNNPMNPYNYTKEKDPMNGKWADDIINAIANNITANGDVLIRRPE